MIIFLIPMAFVMSSVWVFPLMFLYVPTVVLEFRARHILEGLAMLVTREEAKETDLAVLGRARR